MKTLERGCPSWTLLRAQVLVAIVIVTASACADRYPGYPMDCSGSGCGEFNSTQGCETVDCGGGGCDTVDCGGGSCETADCSGGSCDSTDCGECGDGHVCLSDGSCRCIPQCDGKQCGEDGCGGSCGECPGDYSCDGNQCKEPDCEPDCDGRQCGDDGCGDPCGDCLTEQEVCTEQGQCLCIPLCDGKECGSDGCGGTFGDCGDLEECSESLGACVTAMVGIPAGTFWMGCNSDLDPHCVCPGTECDYHLVSTEKYDIDSTEVTNAQYVDFLNAYGNSCSESQCIELQGDEQVEENDGLWSVKDNKGNHPMVAVTWYGAKAYCEWRCPECRLCTEAEWEKAARGGCEFYVDCGAQSRIWPWGNQPPSPCDGATAVYTDCNCGGGTCAVGTHPNGNSLYEVLDLAGNVKEWVEDWYHSSYDDDAPDDGTAWLEPESSVRVIRGGAFGNDGVNGVGLRVSHRSYEEFPSDGFGSVGFRCCK